MQIQIIGQEPIEIAAGVTARDVARQLHLTEPGQALAVIIGGVTRDLDTPIQEGDRLEFLDFTDARGKEVFWHTSAHLLAQAVLRLFPDAKPTIGPPIEQGFYYDFAHLPISEEDLPRIEAEMERIVAENPTTKREVLEGKKAALQTFGSN